MSPITVAGPWPGLRGEAKIPGAKNAAMPILAAAALSPGRTRIRGLPRIADIAGLVEILRRLGVNVSADGDEAVIGPRAAHSSEIPETLSRSLRGSVYALALPAVVFGRATSGPIGGDRLSGASQRRARLLPHTRAFAGFGMSLSRTRGGWSVTGGPPRAGVISLDDDGVSASALAAILGASIDGESVIRGVSHELEVDDTLAALRALGAEVHRDGDTVVVKGPLPADDVVLTIPPDRIHAGTLAIAAAVTGGRVEFAGDVVSRLAATLEALEAAGVSVSTASERICVCGRATRPVELATGMYPEFPTDLLPIFTVLAAQAPGRSILEERVYDTRTGHLVGLRAMGVRAAAAGSRIIVEGPTRWRPACVSGAGIRETAALVVASLAAPGETHIDKEAPLHRGYEDLLRDLVALTPTERGDRLYAA